MFIAPMAFSSCAEQGLLFVVVHGLLITVASLVASVQSVQSLSHVRLFRPHESQHARPLCPSPTPGVYSDSCPSSQ